MEIRELTNKDIGMLLKLERKIINDLNKKNNANFIIPYADYEIENFSNKFRFLNLGAFEGKHLIGSLQFKKNQFDIPDFDCIKDRNGLCMASHAYVDSNCRNNNVMTMLCNTGIAKMKSCKSVVAIVRPENQPPQHVMKKAGLIKFGQHLYTFKDKSQAIWDVYKRAI